MAVYTDYRYLPKHRLELTIIPCPSCGNPHKLIVGEYDFENWADGVKLVQEAFPYLTPPERELLMTGIDEECFSMMRRKAEIEEAGEMTVEKEISP